MRYVTRRRPAEASPMFDGRNSAEVTRSCRAQQLSVALHGPDGVAIELGPGRLLWCHPLEHYVRDLETGALSVMGTMELHRLYQRQDEVL